MIYLSAKLYRNLFTILAILLISFSIVPIARAQQAQLQINPVSGPPGTTVTVNGSGFPTNSDVIIGPGVFASEPVTTARITTNAQGGFTTQVTIPANADPDRRWVIAANRVTQTGTTILADFDVTHQQTDEDQAYVVRSGDFLARIAAQLNTTVAALVRANPQIEDPNLIFPGQELVIPGALVVIPDTGQRVYIVQQGDTLSEIASRFGVTVEELVEANDIDDPNRILRGQRLEINAPVNVIPETGETVYIVQGGDTLSEIAVSFRTTVSDLVDANSQIEDPNLIYPGMRLSIPDTGES
jgi:LysM repeat protein